ncbi:kinase-like protein [Laetiporus sulphureus 93-53]|uniref:Kinase-like protein n=1 Tax=Laetiporus sulphureus 93-53 TaxID=1314785 RepID=A0A165IIL9_9APHY|nr:kinase-like protein [Laetiporus sulphureus 93-53]KZT13126.1 kinase-like protein [Laetiporus sulphureus 93-53]
MVPELPGLIPDDFHFSSMETTEDMTRYVPGGYHPIIIGDIIGSSLRTDSASKPCQYRIMHKLGFGSYATVWLAQKMDSSGALNGAAQWPAVATWHDAAGSLTLRGPNGTHSVLVTDVVAPIISFPSPRRPPHWRKAVAYGLAQSLAHLHATCTSVMLGLPCRSSHIRIQTYDLTIVLPCSAAKQTRSLPAYVVAPCRLTTYYEKLASSDPPVTKIFDFGNAHKAGTLPLNLQCAVEACAPEVVYALVIKKTENPPVEPPADVWALGAVIFEIVTGSPLFYGVGMPALPSRMSKMAGYVPPKWRSWRPDLTISPDQADAWWTSRKTLLRQGCVDDKDTDALVRLLKKVLVLDATIRPTIVEVLQDPWFHDDAAHEVQI